MAKGGKGSQSSSGKGSGIPGTRSPGGTATSGERMAPGSRGSNDTSGNKEGS